LNARFIGIAFGGRIVFVCTPRYISIAFSGRGVLFGAQFLNARYISIAFGGRIVLVGALNFSSTALGGLITLVGVLKKIARIPLKIQMFSLNFRIHGTCRRA
jgi:hypothetical protein